MYEEEESSEAKIGDLRPGMRNVNVDFKVLELGEKREVTSRYDNSPHSVTEAKVADETGNVLLTLWDQTIDEVEAENTYRLENGYTNLFKGHLRLNVGKYGKLEAIEKEFEEIDEENDISAPEHAQQRRPRRGGYGSYGGGQYGGSSYGGGRGSYGGGGRRRQRRY
jgi:replication factor A1